MKVMLVAPNYPPEFAGGTEQVVVRLARGLADRGHEVTVFAGSRKRLPQTRLDREEHDGIVVWRSLRHDVYEDVIDIHDAECDEVWDRLLAEVRPDVVHVHHWANLSNALVAIAARRGIASVVSLHDFWATCSRFFRLPAGAEAFCEELERADVCVPCNTTDDPIERGEKEAALQMRKAALRQELGLATAWIVPGEGHRHRLARFEAFPTDAAEKVHVVAPATEIEGRWEPGDDDADRIVVAHWGNLSPVKGIEVLARACAKSRHAARLALRLIGRGSSDDWLLDLETMAGAARVEFVGAYDATNLAARLVGAHFACFPSLAHETHSLVVDEALALGLPMIVSDRGAMPERVGGRGLVVTAADDDALAEALDRLVAPDERRRLRDGAPAKIARIDDHVEATVSLYEEARSAADDLPAFVPDHGRERLAAIKRRHSEIRGFVRRMWAFSDDLDKALAGDVAALERVAAMRPDLARKIETMKRIDSDGSDVE